MAVAVWLRLEWAAVEVAKRHFFNCKESKRRNSRRKRLNMRGSSTSKTGSNKSDKPKKPD